MSAASYRLRGEGEAILSPIIAILHYAGPPYIGGVEMTIAAHARVMTADGYQVRMVIGKGQDININAKAYMIAELNSRGELVERVTKELAQGSVSADFEVLTSRIMDHLRDALEGVSTVIVHNVLSLHKNLAFTTALYRLHQQNRLPRMLAWCHDFAWLDPLYTPEMHAGEPWDRLRKAWSGVQYVVVSEDRRKMLADLLDLPVEDVAVITPGLDLSVRFKDSQTANLIDRLNLFDSNPLLLLPARITRRKNIQQAIKIIGALQHCDFQPRLLVSGPLGPHNPSNKKYLDELLALCQATGTADAMIFLCQKHTDEKGMEQPVSDEMMGDFYRISDGLLFPSTSEGFGIPMIEALFDRLPIFCSDIPVFREIAGDAACYFDPQGDPLSIAKQIAVRLHDDASYARRREVRRTYTWEAIYLSKIKPLL
jgi:mannosylglucosylglycerate synthase